MKLERGVFYEQYGDITCLRHVRRHKDLVLDGIACDYLDYVRAHPGCTPEELAEALAAEYDLEDPEEFLHDMQEFGQQLAAAGVLESPAPEIPTGSLQQHVDSIVRKDGKLYSAVLEITYRCNERCIHCYVDDEIDASNELTLEEYRRLLDELRDMGCLYLLITGGEVCAHKDFVDIAEYAVSKGFVVNIYTNGLKLTREHIRRLKSLDVNSVSFSLYGPDAKTHDAITQIPGSFDCTLRSMMMCKCAGIDTFAKTVVMKQNFDCLEELFRLGELLDIEISASVGVMASHQGCPADHFRLMDVEKYQKVSELSNRYAQCSAGISTDGCTPGLCPVGISCLCIDPYGNVMPCNAIHEPMGNIREKSLREIRSTAPLLKTLSNLTFQSICPKKGECEDAGWCSICPGISYSENKTWTPTPDICMIAHANHKAVMVLAEQAQNPVNTLPEQA